MTDPEEDPELIDHGASDVLAEDEVVHVPTGVEELAESLEHGSTYLPEVPDWEEPEPPPE
jgi:hypothetical protein